MNAFTRISRIASAEELFGVVRRPVGTIEEPTEAESASLLGVSKAQTKDLLARLVAEGFPAEAITRGVERLIASGLARTVGDAEP